MAFNAVVISGPSGVGKGTLCKRLLAAHPTVFTTTASHTTREPRAGEIHSESYYYVSRAEFNALIANDAFIEHAVFNGHQYGTSKQTVLDQAAKGSVVLLDIEMEGVKQLKKGQQQLKGQGAQTKINYRFVFIQPPDLATLEARLRGRGADDEASVQRRLARAREEMAYAQTPGVHDRIIVNRDLETAYRELEAFVLGKATGSRAT